MVTSTVCDDSDLRDLTPADVLSYAIQQRRAADTAEARLLAAAVVWVDLHPVTDSCPAVSFRAPHGIGVPVLIDTEARLAGVSTPGISEFAVETLAAAGRP